MNSSSEGQTGPDIQTPANDLSEFGDAPKVSAPSSTPPLKASPTKPDDAKEEKEPKGRCQWASKGPKAFTACGRTFQALKKGVYGVENDRGEPFFVQKDINVDGLYEFPDSQADKILAEIDGFWNREPFFTKYGYLHRRGYLLFGPPGSGKTGLIQQVIQRIIRADGLVFLCGSPTLFAEGLGVFRQVEPDRPIVCIYEDIDAIIKDYGEDALLSVLDGESQINKVLNVASTNYPERLDKRIIARPRRFDRVMKVGMPSAKVREVYFRHKLLIDNNSNVDELELWVKSTEGFSFASMAELVISVKCLGNDFDQSLKILKKLMEGKHSSEEFERSMGFGGGG